MSKMIYGRLVPPTAADPMDDRLNPIEHTTICDRCAAETPVEETQNGPPGEWANATLCNDCYAEELP